MSRKGLIALMVAFTFASAPALAKTVKLVALGDSLTAGYNLPRADSFAAQLETALRAKGYDVSVANAGVSGDTASGGLARLDWSVPKGTDGVILELGANDMLRGLNPDIARQALGEIIVRLKARGIPVLLAGMRASLNMDSAYRREFDSIYPDLAAQYGLPLYPFFLDGIVGDRSLNLPDGLHPTAQGVARIVSGILPQVEAFLAQIGAPKPAGAQ
ncbi:arylesterase [Roseixanthobacter glucoisosaccharinicivorans]|uniref:arylesterase n=1 Tax=Roseixanthobacter glucoisosaccharinicivorans TaxID=3119923 RepID=UPI00372CF7A3